MGNRKYSNKGVNSARNAAPQKKDNSSLVALLIGAGLVLIIIVSLLIALGANNQGGSTNDGGSVDYTQEINSEKLSAFKETTEKTEYVKITFKDYGDVIVRLRPDIAPITVENFQSLVSQKFYDGLTMHRIINDFMIQGGDGKLSDGKDPATIKGEFSVNGVQNTLSHIPGVISMARANPYDSASSQFFIVSGPNATHLDGQYAGFGYVVAGLNVVTEIQKVDTDSNDKPLNDVIIEKICFVKK